MKRVVSSRPSPVRVPPPVTGSSASTTKLARASRTLLFRLCALALVAAGLGCQATAIAPPAKLLGLRDMVKIGEFIVVTSSEHDELRVLETVLPLEPGVRGYVGAPNPLEPLAITVLPRPTMLAVDNTWTTTPGSTVPFDRQLTGPYVYAASAGTPAISIVGVGTGMPGPDGGITTQLLNAFEFVELKRLLTSSPVTAMAASTEHGSSQLFYATYDGTTAQLSTVILPAAGDLVSMDTTALNASITVQFGMAAGEVIIDIVTMPGDRLAIATRSLNGLGGRSFVYNLKTGAVTPLLFPSPVRRLAIHGGTNLGYPNPPTNPTSNLAPGDRIFGVINEEACDGGGCGGIIAVESSTGQICMDLPGLEAVGADGGAVTDADRQMMVIQFGNALNTGIDLSPLGAIEVPAANLPPDPVTGAFTSELEELSVLGSVTLSTGAIVNFNAGDLTMFDADDTTTDGLPFVSSTTITDVIGDLIVDPSAPAFNAGPYVDGGIFLTDGMARDETVIVIYEGLIAGLTELPANGTQLAVDGGFEGRAQPNDFVVADLCTLADHVTPYAPDAGIFDLDGGLLYVGLVNGIDAGTLTFNPTGPCAQMPTMSIRANGATPFTVEGDSSGYMGRGGPNVPVDFVGSYFRHPFGYAPGRHQMLMNFVPSIAGLVAEDRWSLVIEDNFNPLIYTLDPTAAGCAVPVSLLGEIIDDSSLQRLFVASPAADGILDIDPSVVIRGVLYAGMVCYR